MLNKIPSKTGKQRIEILKKMATIIPYCGAMGFYRGIPVRQ